MSYFSLTFCSTDPTAKYGQPSSTVLFGRTFRRCQPGGCPHHCYKNKRYPVFVPGNQRMSSARVKGPPLNPEGPPLHRSVEVHSPALLPTRPPAIERLGLPSVPPSMRGTMVPWSTSPSSSISTREQSMEFSHRRASTLSRPEITSRNWQGDSGRWTKTKTKQTNGYKAKRIIVADTDGGRWTKTKTKQTNGYKAKRIIVAETAPRVSAKRQALGKRGQTRKTG